MRIRHATAALVLAAGLWGRAQGAPHDRAQNQTSCRFAPPPGMEPGARAWLGACRNGFADGPGVLRTIQPAGPPVLYFGDMAAGRPTTGVVERGGDFYPLAGSDREANIQAFRAAAEGARASARRFKAQGNLPSAKYYDAQAVRLNNALD